MMQFPLHDLHIHTNLSECSRDPLQTVENIVRYAAEHHIPTVGISNHVWDGIAKSPAPATGTPRRTLTTSWPFAGRSRPTCTACAC